MKLKSKWLKATLFFVWFAVIAIPLSTLMISHSVAFSDSKKVLAMQPALPEWQMVHILVADCDCSAAIAKYLEERGPQKNLLEKVFIIGESSSMKKHLSERGFEAKILSEDEAAKEFGIEGGPRLLVIDPLNKNSYSGGYSESPITGHGEKIRDLEILAKLQRNELASNLPAYGCAVGEALRKKLDPLGLKYAFKRDGEQN